MKGGARTPSGVAGLDPVLGGGLPTGRSTLVAGTSGSGKTVLGLQFVWEGATSFAEPGVLVSFEERPGDLFANVTAFGWDMAGLVDGGRLAVVDATPEEGFEESGPYDFGGLLARVEHEIRRIGARRLLVDAVDAVFSQFGDAAMVRRELGRVIHRLRSLGVTALITAERLQEYGPVTRRDVEEFVFDNVLILRNVVEGRHRRRTVEALKMRGFAHNKGEYAYVISSRHGMRVVPLSAIESERAASYDVLSLGDDRLDAMCGGGIYRDSLLLVSGPTGTGKSLLAAQFVTSGLAAGERVILFSFEENPAQVVRNARSVGIDLAGPAGRGQLEIISRFPERMGLEDLLVAVQEDVERFEPARVVIDSLTALEHSASPGALRDLVIGVSAFLKARSVASLVTTTPSELTGAGEISGAELSTLTDGIILLRYLEVGGEMRRVVLVLKMRGRGHDRAVHEYEITDGGLRFGGPIRIEGPALGGAPGGWPLAGETGGHGGGVRRP